ncbi:MAG: alpha/beta hydrolase [Candidatus Kapaibacterium sp.]
MHNKKDIILLHGALGTSQQFTPLISHLESEYNIHTFDLPAHGELAYQADMLSMYSFANYVRNYIIKNNLHKPLVFGFSMGGFVALTLQSQTNIFSKIMTLNTKLEWDKETAEREQKMFDPEIILEKVPHYADMLNAMHGDNWKNLLAKHRNMMFTIAKSTPLTDYALSKINIPVLLTKGDRDNMVTSEETKIVADKLSTNYYEFENTAHPIEKIDLNLLSSKIKEFLI